MPLVTSVTIIESILANHKHSQPIGYIEIHSLYCTSYVYGQI